MSYVLSLQHTGTGGEHWFNSTVYGKKQIEAIQDPQGGETHIAPTSIPSPFAQIDLARTAFINVCKNRNLSSTIIDLKLVSDCLDIGEVFFHSDRLKDKVKIIRWDRKKDLENLLQSPLEAHRRLGKVLELFLEQDAETYNFNECRCLNLLTYDNQAIGGTSPKTLFFASANDLSFVDIKISTDDRLFDQDYKHLWQRSDDYIKFLFSMRKATPNFGTKFREVNEYLDLNLEIIRNANNTLYREIESLTGEYYAKNFPALDVDGPNDAVFILNDCVLRKLQTDTRTATSGSGSDFRINSTKNSAPTPPLVLVPGHDGRSQSGKPLTYFQNAYNSDVVKPPYYNSNPNLDERDLPGITGVKYPHLLTSDFLEPYLIRLVYPVNKTRFFDGNLNLPKELPEKGYLLPIKPAFFDYFDTDFLNTMLPDGNKVLEIKVTKTEAVEVKLRIPIQNDNYITFERLYHAWTRQSGIPTPDETINKGYIVENQFGVNIFPFVKLNNPDADAKTVYRVILVDRDLEPFTQSNNYHLSFFQNRGNHAINQEVTRQRSDKRNGIATTKIYALEREFDYIRVEVGIAKGVLIPYFIEKSKGHKQFSFSIDFGTTNTHIEYKSEDNRLPVPFEISTQDVQIGTLGDYAFYEKDPTVNNTRAISLFEIPQHLLPEKIGKGSNFRFPQRTVLYENPQIDFRAATFALADMHIPFDYEKLKERLPATVKTNLKWSDITMDGNDQKRVRAYFEQLIFMIRAKVLLNDGDLEQTKLVWFYPSSMTPSRRGKLEQIWHTLFEQYICPKPQEMVSSMLESLAPFYYYTQNKGLPASASAIFVDIGGGTTDVVAFKDKKPVFLTSFRFAANAIYGDGYSSGNASNNGFVQRYEEKIRSLLDANNLNELLKVLDDIRGREISEDIIAFFFSLENNSDIIGKKITENFHDFLSDDRELKIVFVIFYTAIIYHIANLMAAKKMDLPSFITFSGNGSKSLSIIGNNKLLEKFTRLIFEKVYEKRGYSKEDRTFGRDGLSIFLEKGNAKESTCKGGLFVPAKNAEIDTNGLSSTLLGSDKQLLAEEAGIRYGDKEAVKALILEVNEEVNDFIDFAINLNRDFSFNDYFSASVKNIEGYRDVLKRYMNNHIMDGLEQRLEEMEDNSKEIDETLFFYPLVAALNRLATHIHDKVSNKKNT